MNKKKKNHFWRFKVTLKGPRQTGKSTFIALILRKLMGEGFEMKQVGAHELEVTLKPRPFP